MSQTTNLPEIPDEWNILDVCYRGSVVFSNDYGFGSPDIIPRMRERAVSFSLSNANKSHKTEGLSQRRSSIHEVASIADDNDVQPSSHHPKRKASCPSPETSTLRHVDHSDKPDVACMLVDDLFKIMCGLMHVPVKRLFIIDCRYPFEFEYGHIQGAINLFTHADVFKFYENHKCIGSSSMIVFHCEFSSVRGPEMFSFFRKLDRTEHGVQGYPSLHFPQAAVLQRGYKEFWSSYPTMCVPENYVCMDDSRFTLDKFVAEAEKRMKEIRFDSLSHMG